MNESGAAGGSADLAGSTKIESAMMSGAYL